MRFDHIAIFLHCHFLTIFVHRLKPTSSAARSFSESSGYPSSTMAATAQFGFADLSDFLNAILLPGLNCRNEWTPLLDANAPRFESNRPCEGHISSTKWLWSDFLNAIASLSNPDVCASD